MPVLWLLANCLNRISSWKTHRELSVTQKRNSRRTRRQKVEELPVKVNQCVDEHEVLRSSSPAARSSEAAVIVLCISAFVCTRASAEAEDQREIHPRHFVECATDQTQARPAST